ncbi:hypothetical protein BGS_1267 [Beggiatoa sp. SS]|nr:hypothetical protein BGS_1267 [Beggiatoa sp. SS]
MPERKRFVSFSNVQHTKAHRTINKLFVSQIRVKFLCEALCYSVNSIPGSSFCAQKLEPGMLKKVLVQTLATLNKARETLIDQHRQFNQSNQRSILSP